MTWASAPVAAEAAEPQYVEYRASSGCPPVQSFHEQVAARIRVGRSAALPVKLRLVELEAGAGGARGRVVFSGRGHETTRELRAASCAEAVEALALIVAILLDPEADSRPHLRSPSVPPPISRSAPTLATRHPPYFAAGVEWSALGGVAPDTLLGPRGFLEVGRAPARRWLSSLRLSWVRAASASTEQSPGELAAFWLDAARIDGCALRWSSHGASLEPCVGFEAGMLTANSTHLEGSRSRTLGWAAVSGILRGVFCYDDTATIHADLGVGMPLMRYRFRFSGQAPLYTSAELGIRAGIGVGVRFP